MSDLEDGPFVAVIGMAGRFPGAPDVDAYWKNIAEGREQVSFFTPEQVAAAGVPEAVRASKDFVPARAIIDDPLLFDAPFFGFTPAEAKLTDPQQRLFLEVAWEALERAGYDPSRYENLVGVYGGVDVSTYVIGALTFWTYDISSLIGNDKDYLATRVCHRMNLRGPGLTIQTACSTSLVAVQVACQQLLGFQCDIALAGGAGIAFPRSAGYLYQPGGIASPDGHCRPFDAKARGTVGGDGVGVVALKRLAEAIADGDTIHAVIRGAAINNDGAQKVGFTAPSVEGQAEVITMALAMADVSPATIGYVECHGTATELGDPVEIAALTEAYRAHTDARGYCAIGSVKSNVGHMNSAAGVGGLIKVIKALEARQIPPSLHFEAPNPRLDLEASPFFVSTKLAPWEALGAPRRAAVSSFGVGGTNAHVVLEEAPERPPSGPSRSRQLVVVSAQSEAALREATDRLAAHVEAHPEQAIADVAHTLLVGRKLHKYRRMAVVSSASEVRAALAASAVVSREPRRAPVAFLFPGQGAQRVNMARRIYETEAIFRDEVDACAEVLRPALDLDLREVLYPAPDRVERAAELLSATRLAQPALFVVEHALARWWMAMGVEPDAMVGHSVGEYVAACLAGVFSRDDALRLVALRGAIVERLPRGAMLAVALPEALAAELPGVVVAATNAPDATVVSGPIDAIDAAERELRQRGVWCARLATSHAFHAPMMDPAVDELRAAVARVARKAPSIPYVSNLTGTWITEADAIDPACWARHLRQPVRFSECVAALLAEPDRLLLEVGPGRALSALVAAHGAGAKERAIASLGRDDDASLIEALGRLYVADVPVAWRAYYAGEDRRRVPLPTYPFERRAYQYDAAPALGEAGGEPASPASIDAAPDALARRASPDAWLHAPSWKRAPARRPPAPRAGQRWIVVDDGSDLASAIRARLTATGAEVTMAPRAPDDLGAGAISIALVAVRSGAEGDEPRAALALCRALAHRSAARARVVVVTSGVADVLADDPVVASRAPILGVVQAAGQELPHVRARVVDVRPGDAGEAAVDRVLAEADEDAEEPLVAHRGGRRWIPCFEPIAPPQSAASLLREGGVYLVTGGFGRIGSAIAEHLARAQRARLVLASRSASSPAHAAAVRALEALGAEVLVIPMDVTDEAQVADAVDAAVRRFGALHGVVHAAGSAGEGAIRALADTSPEDLDAHLAPKARALSALARVLPRSLDVCVLASSLSTVLGGAGLGAYAAAHHLVDAFARVEDRRGGPRWIAVDWDAWSLAEGAAARPGLTALSALAIGTAEGGAAFSSILAAGDVDRVIVSTVDLAARRDRDRRSREAARAALGDDHRAGVHGRPELDTPYVAPRTATERALAGIWQKLLGIEPVGVDDNFFKLGGDSLLAIQLGTRLRDTLGVEVPIHELFDEPTIAALAARLDEKRPAAETKSAVVEATLAMVEKMSEEEVQRMLAELSR